jgi:hypothetical protein
MSLVWIASAAVGIGIGCAIYYAFVKAELFRLSRYEYWSDRFYAAAKPLVANPETPQSIVSLIESLSKLITKKSAPIGIAEVFRDKIESASKRSEAAAADEQFHAFFKKFPHLTHNAEVVSHAGLLAASYVHWAGGAQARAILADTFSEMELRNREIGDVADVRKVERINRGPSLVPMIIMRR